MPFYVAYSAFATKIDQVSGYNNLCFKNIQAAGYQLKKFLKMCIPYTDVIDAET